MEDPSEEYDIQEYSAKVEGGKARWVLSRGLGLGKKILVIGIVVSSAPFVLPPLVVISALGFALSVPSGLYFASYACTEKLMGKLLPIPQPPLPLFEYEAVDNEEEVSDGGEVGDVGGVGDIDMEKEEEETLENMQIGIETRIELREQGTDKNNDFGEYGQGCEQEPVKCMDEIVEQNGHKVDIGEYMDEMVRESVEMDFSKVEWTRAAEEGEEGPLIADTMLEQPVEAVLGVVALTEGGEVVAGHIAGMDTPFVLPSNEGDQLSIISDEDIDLPIELINITLEESNDLEKGNDTEGIRKEVEKLLEICIDHGPANEDPSVVTLNKKGETGPKSNAEMHIEVQTIVTEDSQKKGSETESFRKEEEREAKQLNLERMDEKPVNGASGVEASKKDEIAGQCIAEMDTPSVEDIMNKVNADEVKAEELTRVTTGLIEIMKDEGKDEVAVQELKNGDEETCVVGSQKDAKKTKKCSRKKGKKVVERRDEKVSGEDENAIELNFSVLSKVIKPVEEMGSKNGRDSFEADKVTGDTSESINLTSVIEVERRIRNPEPISQVGGTNKDVAVDTTRDLLSSADARQIANDKAYRQHNDAVDGSCGGTDTSSYEDNKSGVPLGLHISSGVLDSKDTGTNEVLYSEDNIWEQIDAIRKILGYNTPLHATCIEELKALYVFTGVELPASFKDHSGIAEVNEKLHFLMSIIGVQ